MRTSLGVRLVPHLFGFLLQLCPQADILHRPARPRRRGELFRTQTETPHACLCDHQCIQVARTLAHRQTRESRITNQGSVLFDLIVSNPPYVGRSEAAALAREVREHEPAIALFGGEEGYELYAELIAQSLAHLKPGGILILELGHNSRAAVEPLLDSPDWTNVRVTNDLAGIARVLSSEKACEFASNALL